MNLNQMLNDIAHRITIVGTVPEAVHLERLANAVAPHAPGVAAALVDWNGPEVARSRAFGLASGTALNKLAAREQANLMADLLGGAPRTVAA